MRYITGMTGRMIIPGIVLILGMSCERQLMDPENSSFTIDPKYSMVRSYPGGGGLFVIRLIPDEAFTGPITLSAESDPRLHIEILENPVQLSDSVRVAEISIWPDTTIPIQNYPVHLSAVHDNHVEQTDLQVEIIEWEDYPPSEDALMIREAFIPWLIQNIPQCSQLAEESWADYMTYPQILVVEHWSSVSDAWEMRFCFHVMIAPYDWSMIWLRPRGKSDPIITAKRESNGTIHIIPAEEYPAFGY
jgi:hypothetical protein